MLWWLRRSSQRRHTTRCHHFTIWSMYFLNTLRIFESKYTFYFFQYDSVCSHCQNGGACSDPNSEQCDCLPGFEGQYCEILANSPDTQTYNPTDNSRYHPCEVQPCQRNGTCRPIQGGLYKCDCPFGTGGFNCQNRNYLFSVRYLRKFSFLERFVVLWFQASSWGMIVLSLGKDT